VQGGITAARKALTDPKSKRDRGERTSDPRLTFNAAADAWWAARVVKLRPDHADRRQRRAAAPSGRLRAGFGLTRLADIGPTEVARYGSQRDAKGWTVKGKMTVLSGVFTSAGRHLGFPRQNSVTLLDHVERPSSADEKPNRILAGDGLRACSPPSSPSTASSSRRPPRRAHGWPRRWASFAARSISTRRPSPSATSLTAMAPASRGRPSDPAHHRGHTVAHPKLREHKLASGPHDLVFVTRVGTPHDHRNVGGRVMARAVKRAGLKPSRTRSRRRPSILSTTPIPRRSSDQRPGDTGRVGASAPTSRRAPLGGNSARVDARPDDHVPRAARRGRRP